MVKWRIIGAEAQTGEDRSIEVNARDEAGAREAARMLGMLVVRVERLESPQGPVLDYRSPGPRHVSPSIPTAEVVPPTEVQRFPSWPSHYPAILTGVKAATAAARVLYHLGMLALMAAAFSAISAAVFFAIPRNRPLLPVVVLIVVVTGIGGAMMLAAATALQLMSATSLAIRDAARNSTPPPTAASRAEDISSATPSDADPNPQ